MTNRLLPITLVLLSLIGCARTSYSISIDGVTDPDRQSGKRFFLYPGEPNVPSTDLYFREYAGYVRRALVSRGYFESTPDSADFLLLFRYGLGDPQIHTYTYSVPIIERTVAGTTSFNMTTFGSDGISTTTGTVKTKPKYDVVGSQTYSGSYTSYLRFMVLDAFDLTTFRKDSTLPLLWRTVVSSEGSSNDLRRVVPVMVAASETLIGKNTGQRIDVQLNENDPRVSRIRSQSAPR